MLTFKHIKYDLPAGIVVFLVAVPLCLGIAMASGAPLFSGIIAGIVGGVVVSLVSGSQLGVSGPAAGLAVIVLTSIEKLQSFEVFLCAVFLAGILQVMLGFIRAGSIGYYFPSSVIKGMLSGIGIIIILKQIPHAIGYDSDFQGDLHFFQPDGDTTFSGIWMAFNYISPAAVIISSVSLLILVFWDSFLSKKHKIFQIVQGPLVVVVLGIVFNMLFQNYFPFITLKDEHLVVLPVSENIGGFLSQFTTPDFSRVFSNEVWVIAVTIAIVASLETLLCLEATDKLDPFKRISPANRELKAQGIGNIIAGLIGGLPITQVIVRSSANIQSGGRTNLSAFIHGVLILGCVIAIPHILNMIPLASLAAILLVVGYKLAKPALFLSIYKTGWTQFIPFIITIIAIVLTDLLTGIAIGMAFAIFFILRNSYKVSHTEIKEISPNGRINYRVVLAEEVTFLNKGAIMHTLKNIPENVDLEIDLSKSKVVDFDVLEVIENFKETATLKHIRMQVLKHTGDKIEPVVVQRL